MSDATQYGRIVIDRYRYHGHGGREAWCALEVQRGRDGRTVVIATEVKDNPGMSVTNAVEHLAYRVCVEFSIHPSKLVWVEHYGYPAPGDGEHRPRKYDRVTFDVRPPGRHAVFANPAWRPMRNDDWLALGLEPRQPGS